MNTHQEKAKKWLSEPFDKETQAEIKQLIESQSPELTDRFYKNIEFGTGGMRGIMGAGTNRINKYTLGKATQGLSNYLQKKFKNQKIKVVIAYDCRNHSAFFGQLVAEVFSANGIQAFLFEDLRPTPELSFAVRHLNCHAGIVITASHNPPEYNGYKVYWNDGGQIVPPQDAEIIQEVEKLNFDEIKFNGQLDLIQKIGKEIDDAFIDAAIAHSNFGANKKAVKIVFTALHGTSSTIVPQALNKAGFSQVHLVEAQNKPDGNFPTVKSPNPEEPEALQMAMDLAKKIDADILIGTDPDCDRLGIAVRDLKGNLTLLNGNQTMCLMTDFLLKKWQEQGKLNGKQFVGSTIVSTDLFKKIADSYGVETKLGLTGFKWIAKMIREFEGEKEFIGGGEESYGYLVGDFVRDKDAVTATLLACEIAAYYKEKGSSAFKKLMSIYIKHSFYKEQMVSMVKKGKEGAEEISQMIADYRTKPIQELDGAKVIYFDDYQSSTRLNLLTNEQTNIKLPKSNVLIFETSDDTKIAIRPSGTEPKIKFYFSVKANLNSECEFEETERILKDKIQRICKDLGL